MFCALLATSLTQTTVDLPRFPSLSPNGDRICFSWRGDLWSVSSSGGHAQRLTAHSANETRSAWSPDGAEIVFESDRDGVRNLWCMAADGTNVRQLTTLDRPVTLSAVAEEQIWFSAYLELDVYRSERPYMIPAKAATPCGCMTPSARPRSPAKTGKCSLCVAGTTTAGPAVISAARNALMCGV